MEQLDLFSQEEIWAKTTISANYEVSNIGNVRSLLDNFKRKRITPKILKKSKYRSGYYYVNIYSNGVIKKMKVHRLVAMAFIPNPNNKPHINHLNAVRTDNRVENLEWCTAKENVHYTWYVSKRGNPNIGKQFKKQWIGVSKYTLTDEFIESYS